MSALEHRPAFGDVYVSEGDAHRTHCAAAVRVLGWTAKYAIVERLPLITTVTLSHPTEHRTTSIINVPAVQPLPPTPRTSTGRYERMHIEWRESYVAGEPVTIDLLASDADGPEFRQVFTRCAMAYGAWQGTTTRYY